MRTGRGLFYVVFSVLLETTDFLYLIEKYNPQEPYQVSKFKHIDEIISKTKSR